VPNRLDNTSTSTPGAASLGHTAVPQAVNINARQPETISMTFERLKEPLQVDCPPVLSGEHKTRILPCGTCRQPLLELTNPMRPQRRNSIPTQPDLPLPRFGFG
jgi:hypothetical protein